MRDEDKDALLALFVGFLAGVLLALALFNIGFDGKQQRALNESYCTDFARVFVINEDNTWECVTE